MNRTGGISAAIVLGLCVQAAPAAPGGRAGTWNAGIRLSDTLADDHDTDGARAHSDSSIGVGMGVAYNFSGHWALGAVFDWSSIDYDATLTSDRGVDYGLSGTTDVGVLALEGTYYFTEGRLAPFVSAQLGMAFIDTDVPDGPPQTVCWYDPWWGYYCGAYVPTHSESDLSYGAVGGLRWDVSRNFFVRGEAGVQWTEVGGDVGTLDSTVLRLEAGWRVR